MLGRFMIMEAILMLAPLVTALIFREESALSFVITIVILLALGFICNIKAPRKQNMFAKEGLVIVGLAWLVLSIFGALPFYISREIPRYIDCFFETVSGFTTTGATILAEIESLPRGILFWRAFTHWIGGMGVLVFMLAVMPKAKTYSMHLMRAEVPGPTVGKLVSKMSVNARILYLIYLVLTVAETLFLMAGGMSFYDALTTSFSTGGTGGFSVRNASIAAYDSAYIDGVITVFMIIFGVNFNLFYLMLIGRVKDALKSEELRWYLGIIALSIAAITINTLSVYGSVARAFRYSSFQVASIISTTGFITADYEAWPMFSQVILILLMFIGGCAGSTGGGLKVMRISVLLKSAFAEIKTVLFPRSINTVKIDGKTIEHEVYTGVKSYFLVYMIMMFASVILVSFDSLTFNETVTAVITCVNNVGPGLGKVGAVGNYSSLSAFSKLVLSFDMLAGRLELYPVLILFFPWLWRK